MYRCGPVSKSIITLEEVKSNEESLPNAGHAYISLHYDTCFLLWPLFQNIPCEGHGSWLLIPDFLCDSPTHSPIVATDEVRTGVRTLENAKIADPSSQPPEAFEEWLFHGHHRAPASEAVEMQIFCNFFCRRWLWIDRLRNLADDRSYSHSFWYCRGYQSG